MDAKTRDELEAHLGDRTAMIAGLSIAERQGVFAPPFEVHRAPPPDPGLIKPEALIAIGNNAGVPVLVDMASDLPPGTTFTASSTPVPIFVVLSGGKCIGGPQAPGILLGKDPYRSSAAQREP